MANFRVIMNDFDRVSNIEFIEEGAGKGKDYIGDWIEVKWNLDQQRHQARGRSIDNLPRQTNGGALECIELIGGRVSNQLVAADSTRLVLFNGAFDLY